MRTIKFRVWDNFHKSETPCFWYSDRVNKFWEFWHWIDTHPCPKENIQQFTGLTDARAQEIYEGDILVANKGKSYESNYKVYWKRNSAGFSLIHATGEGDKYGIFTKNLDYDTIKRDTLEVIGNIYQTPELTK